MTMKEIGREKKEKLISGSLFFFYMIFQWIVTFNNMQFSFTGDEFGGLAVPTTLAGNNWNTLIQDVNYYGYGFRWIYCFLFKVTDDPGLIYSGILYINIVMMCLLYGLCLFMLRRRKKLTTLGIPLSFVFYLVPIAIGTKSPLYSEYSLFATTVLWAVCMVKLLEADTKGKRRVISGVLAFIMVYMLTLHERSLAFILAFCLTVIIDWIYEKKCLISLETAVPVYIVFKWVQDKIKKYIVAYFWGSKLSSGASVGNTEVAISNPTWFIESRKNFKIFLDCLFANIGTETIISLGTYLIMFLFAIVAIVEFFRKEKKWKSFYEENHVLFLFLMVSFFTVSATIVGIAVDWGKNIAVGNIYGYKGYAYVRYYNVWSYIGMFALLILLQHLMKKVDLSKLKLVALLLFGMITAGFYLYMWPILKNAMGEMGNSMYMERIGIFGSVTSSIENSMIFTVLFGAFVILAVMAEEKRNQCLLFCMSVFLCLGIKDFTMEKTDVRGEVDEVYHVIHELKDYCELPQEIYYLTNSRESRFLMQFTLNRYSVMYELPEETLEQGIAITVSGSGSYAEYLLEHEYTSYVLDNGKCLWVKGEDYQNAVREYQAHRMKEVNELNPNYIEYQDTAFVLGNLVYQKQPGEVLRCWMNTISYGKYECRISYDANDSNEDFVDVYENGEITASAKVEMDDNGRATASFVVDSRYNNYNYFTLVTQNKKWIRNVEVEYTCMEKYSSLGDGKPEEFELLKSYMDQIGLKKPVKLLSNYNYIELDSNLRVLEELFKVDDISVWNYKKLQEYLQSGEKDSYIILYNNNSDSLIFDLVDAYDILCVTKNYTLLAYRDGRLAAAEEKAEITPFNKENAVSLYFLRQNGTEVLKPLGEIMLPAGCYELSILPSDIPEESFLLSRNNGETIEEEFTVSKEGMQLSFVADGTTEFSMEMDSSEEMDSNRVYIARTGNLHIGDRVDFRKDAANQYTGAKMYAPDEDGAWTSKKKTALTLPVEAEGNVTVSITMRSAENQTVELYAGEDLMDTVEVSDIYETYDFVIPKSYVKNNQLELVIRCLVLSELPEELQDSNTSSMKKAGIKLQQIELK